MPFGRKCITGTRSSKPMRLGNKSSPMPFGRKCITGAMGYLGEVLSGTRCLQCLSAVSALLGRAHFNYRIEAGKSPMPFGRKCITGVRNLAKTEQKRAKSPMPFGRKCITGSKSLTLPFEPSGLRLQCLSAVSALLGKTRKRTNPCQGKERLQCLSAVSALLGDGSHLHGR